VRHLDIGTPGKTVIACLGLACVALLVLTLLGHWQMGAAAAIGVAIGSANGFLSKQGVQLAIGGGAGFGTTSMLRLAILTATGIGIGLLVLGPSLLPFVIGGLALAQLVLVGISALEVSRV
jgi:hypothetical protein